MRDVEDVGGHGVLADLAAAGGAATAAAMFAETSGASEGGWSSSLASPFMMSGRMLP